MPHSSDWETDKFINISGVGEDQRGGQRQGAGDNDEDSNVVIRNTRGQDDTELDNPCKRMW